MAAPADLIEREAGLIALADPVNQAVMAAWANGIVVVTSAGNGGPGPHSIGVPGNNPYVITVGAFGYVSQQTPLYTAEA